jgi:hypothetical protein
MSRRQLVDAYVEGRISRRVFAKRLVATGRVGGRGRELRHGARANGERVRA